jgi:hypothetical protein
LFPGLVVEELLTGNEILAKIDSYCLELRPNLEVFSNEIFIKTGTLVRILNENLDLSDRAFRKFLETNTYNKTFKLGIKRKPESENKRAVFYVNFKYALESISSELRKIKDSSIFKRQKV